MKDKKAFVIAARFDDEPQTQIDFITWAAMNGRSGAKQAERLIREEVARNKKAIEKHKKAMKSGKV